MSRSLLGSSWFVLLLCIGPLATPPAAARSELPESSFQLPPVQSLGQGASCEIDPQSGAIRLLGRDYGASVDDQGLVIVPFLGQRVEQSQHLGLHLRSVERGGRSLWCGTPTGDWQLTGTVLERELAQGLHERLEAKEAGVELSYRFDQRPAGSGDLVVRLELESSFGSAALSTPERLEFLAGPGGCAGGVFVGAVTGISADGQRCAGSLGYRDGELSLHLPGAFVDQAAYPLLLDPLVGPLLTLSTEGVFSNNDDFRPDLAFEAASAQVLVAWERRVSASESRVFARRFSEAGAATSNTVQLSTVPLVSGTAGRPAVATISAGKRWCVVWQEQEQGLEPGVVISGIRIAFLNNNFTVAPASESIHSVFGDAQLDPDVGSVHFQTNFFGIGYGLVVWRDEELNRLAMRPFESSIVGPVYGTTVTLVADSSGPISSVTYSSPSISRSSVHENLDGARRQLVVARAETTGVSAGSKLTGFLLRAPSGTSTQFQPAKLSTFDFHVPAVGGVNRPSIDGLDRRWVCAFESTDSLGNPYIRASTATLDASGNGVLVGAPVDVVAPSPLFDYTRPSVGYSPGKTWIGWRSVGATTGGSTLRLRAYDSNSLTPSEGPFTLDTGDQDADEWISVATAYSGGPYVDAYTLAAPNSGLATIPNYPSENAFVAWSVNDSSGSGDVLGQALSNTSGGGSSVDLGGGCGSQGLVSFPKPPALGTSAWRSVIANLPPTTAAAFYNLTTVNPALASPCGVCLWLPFEVSGSAPLLGTTTKQAVLQLAIPAKPSLVGAQLSVQWTLVDPASSPCPNFPAVSNSAIWRLTLGL
jgi:hypothetical protein